MKKATKLKKIAGVFVNDVWYHKTKRIDAILQLYEMLCDAHCLTTDDFPKSTKCDHGVRFDKECEECNKL